MTDSAEQSPSLEDGYLRIANELFDAILRFGFTHRQQSVLLAVIRKTYGYGKKRDDMSASQLGELCGIARNHVTTTLGELMSMGVIEKWDGQFGCVIGVSKRHKEWRQLEERPAKRVRQVLESSAPKRANPGIAKFKGRFDEFWDTFAYKHSKTRAMKAWMALAGSAKPGDDLEVLADSIMRAAAIEARRRPTLLATGRTPIYPEGWLSQRRFEDEGLLSWGVWSPDEQAFVDVFNANIGDLCPQVADWTEKRSELTKVAVAGKMNLDQWGEFWRFVRDGCEFRFPISYEWFLVRENFKAVAGGQYGKEGKAA